MNNRKKEVKTDLAIEFLKEKDIIDKVNFDDIEVTKIYIDEEKSKIYNKSIGNYITITFSDMYRDKDKIIEITKKELINLTKKYNKVLIVGLGNVKSTPDALGPYVIDNILVSKKVSAISPGTYSGIDTYDYIEAISKKIKPNLIIVIDSLVSKSLERITRTIQISDVGISPGSGVGLNKKEISFKTLSIPVISIGTPTVVDAKTIVSNLVNDNIYIPKEYNYMVTPREIDFDIKTLSFIISAIINESLYSDTL